MSTGPTTRSLRRLTLRTRSIRFSLLQRGAFFCELRASRQILRAIEKDVAVDKCRIDARVDAERVSIPDRDISVLADFNRTDSILNAELNRRIDRDELERLFFR